MEILEEEEKEEDLRPKNKRTQRPHITDQRPPEKKVAKTPDSTPVFRSDRDRSEWKIKVPESLEEMLSDWISIPQHNDYVPVKFLQRVYDLTWHAAKNGIDFKSLGEREIIDYLKIWVEEMEKFKVYKRRAISMYSVTQSFEAFSIDTLVFLCQCNLIMLYDACNDTGMNAMLPKTADYEFLLDNRLLMYDYKIHSTQDYTQTQILVALDKLSQSWKEVPLEDSVERFLNGIFFRVAQIIFECEESFVDGDYDDSSGTKIPTKDFFSHVSALVSYMKTGFLLKRDRMVAASVTNLHGLKDFESYDLAMMYDAMQSYFNENAKFWHNETYGKNIRDLVHVLSLRPGEEEKYARLHQGVYTKDYLDILEAFRTDVQCDNIHERMVDAKKNIPKDLLRGKKLCETYRSRGMVASITNATILKQFDTMCKTECKFDWIETCVVLELDISTYYEKIKQLRHPIVIQTAGEYNILYNKVYYRCIYVELCICIWVILCITKLECNIWVAGSSHDLHFLKKKILKIYNGIANPINKLEKTEKLDYGSDKDIEIS